MEETIKELVGLTQEIIDLWYEASISRIACSPVEMTRRKRGFEEYLLALSERAHKQWIPVQVRLPKEPEHYLVCYIEKDASHIEMAFFYEGRWQLFNDDQYVNPSHWMPLPLPPR